jgi:hypothetical protein
MSSRTALILVICAQFAALPALAQVGAGPGPGPGGGGGGSASGSASGGGASSGEGNVDWRISGPIGSSGRNDAAAVIGTGPDVRASAYAPHPPASPPKTQTAQRPDFYPGSYPSVSECLTAAYAASQPLGRCEGR